nr:DoxX family protein [Oceanospirillum sanctuarii]
MLQLVDRFNQMFDKPDFGLLLLRVAFAGMMLFHGVHKLIAGVGGIEGMLQAQGLPAFIACGRSDCPCIYDSGYSDTPFSSDLLFYHDRRLANDWAW